MLGYLFANKESLKHNLADGMVRNLRTLQKTGHLSVAKGYSLLEKVAPSWFIG
jgi:hypothetical protein